jgi:hypothetical protein
VPDRRCTTHTAKGPRHVVSQALGSGLMEKSKIARRGHLRACSGADG